MNAATPGPAAHPLGVTWLVVLLSLALVAPATAASGAHGSRRTGFTLTVLHNNDGESDLLADPADPDPGAGTISRFGHQVEELRAQALRAGQHTGTKAGVVTVSAGDNFLASPEWQASLDKGVPYYDAIALDSLDYDAFTIGNHEFDFGPDVLANFINSFRGRDDVFLSANLDFSGEPVLQDLVEAGRIRPSIVVRERGERIGIIGVTTPELREVSTPGDVEIDDDLTGVIQAEVDRLTQKGVNKILLSSHLQDIDNELALCPPCRGRRGDRRWRRRGHPQQLSPHGPRCRRSHRAGRDRARRLLRCRAPGVAVQQGR